MAGRVRDVYELLAKWLNFDNIEYEIDSPSRFRMCRRLAVMPLSPTIVRQLCVLTVMLGLAACKPDANVCESSEDCQGPTTLGDVCINGTCQECIEDSQCVNARGEGFACQTGRCEENAQASAPQCSVDQDCANEQGCDGGQCVTRAPIATKAVACLQDHECSGEYCVAGTCQAEPDAAARKRQECREFFSAQASTTREAIFFDFNDYALTTSSRQNLEMTADCLKIGAVSLTLVLEGHCDDRGTQEYNLALGEKRANTVKNYLNALGVDTSRLVTRSKGENEPRCMNPTEDCWSKNRRVELIQD